MTYKTLTTKISTRSRIGALIATVALATGTAFASGTALAGSAHQFRADHPAHTLKTCPPGFVDAQLSWGEKCLHAGEFCKVGNPEYHKYGFDCPPSGHLTYYTAPSGTKRITAATAIAIFPTASKAEYDTRSSVNRIGSLWAGFVGGARATYRDRGLNRPEAIISVYLFNSAANAVSVFAKSCPPTSCLKPTATPPLGMAIRFRVRRVPVGHCLLAASQRTEVLVVIDTCAVFGPKGKPYTVAQLEYDVGYEIGLFQSRAKQLL